MIKKTCLKTYTALVALAVLAVLSGCQNKGVRVKDVNGALYVCRSELKILQSKSSASVDELIEYINLTEQMEDSIISFSVRDTAYAANTKMQDEVLSVSDSLRKEIVRLALSKPRSLADVVYIKTNTVGSASKFVDDSLTRNSLNRLTGSLPSWITTRHTKTWIRRFRNMTRYCLIRTICISQAVRYSVTS